MKEKIIKAVEKRFNSKVINKNILKKQPQATLKIKHKEAQPYRSIFFK